MNNKLTGKTRFRVLKRFLQPDLVVLEVQETWEDGIDDWDGLPTYTRGTGWRDAEPKDLQYLKHHRYDS